MLEILDSAIMQEKTNRHLDQKGVKLPLFADDMALDVENSKESRISK